MNIGIDIDGVLTDISKFKVEYGLKYCNEVKKGKLIDGNVYDTRSMFGWDVQTDLDFWNKNIFYYSENNPPIEGADKYIKKLKELGHNIIIITARYIACPEAEKKLERPDELVEKMKNTVKEWLSKNNIVYDKLIFSSEDKAKNIIENNIDVMIEDSASNLESLSSITKMICFSYPYNERVTGKNIYRCYNWNEIYNKIVEISKE